MAGSAARGIAKAKAAGKCKGTGQSRRGEDQATEGGELNPAAIAKRLGVARSSVYRALV
jgi:hypothetical protein